MSPQLQQFLTLLIPVIVGIVTVPLLDLIKKAASFLNTLPAPVVQAIVILIAWAGNLLASLVGFTFPTSIGGLDSTSLGTIISTILAYILKNAQQISKIKAVTSATNVSIATSNPIAAISQSKGA